MKNPFKKPDSVDIARIKLEEARQQFLHHTAQEAYHGHMKEFYSDMIDVYTDYIHVSSKHDNF